MHWNVKCCCSLWLIIGQEDKSERGILSQGVRNEGKLSQTLLSENTSAVVVSLMGDVPRLHWFWLPVMASVLVHTQVVPVHRPFGSFGHLVHLKMFQICKDVHLISHILQELRPVVGLLKRLARWIKQFKFETIFKYNLVHVSHCIFPPPHDEPQTTQRWGLPCWTDYITESILKSTGRENHLPLCPHTNTWYTKIVCAKWPTVLYCAKAIFKCLWLAFFVI